MEWHREYHDKRVPMLMDVAILRALNAGGSEVWWFERCRPR